MDLAVDHHFEELDDGWVHYVTAGKGQPLLLLHGWPQTWYSWHKLIPPLSQHFRVIAPDLRGLGDSSRPATGFDKKTVAADVVKLVTEKLGIEKMIVVGHDWGGPVAFAMAAFHPGLVEKLVMLDAAVPGDGSGTFSQNGRRWHHAFHQTLDLPELLIAGKEDAYYRWFYTHYGYVRGAIEEASILEYLRTYRLPETARTGFGYYRSMDKDISVNSAYLESDRLQMPVLAIGGGRAFGRGGDTLSSLQRVAVNVRGGVFDQCGHWIPEECPEQTLAAIMHFIDNQ